MIRGKFLAQDDFDLAGHRFMNWQWIADLPTREGDEGQVVAIVDGKAAWATMSADGLVIVEWDDVLNKPTEFTPEDHTHLWSEVTGKPTFVNSIIAGSGISVSSATGTVTISNPTVEATNEPTGFPNQTDSTISFDDGTRTFSIAPAVTSFSVWVLGVEHEFSAAETVTITDTEGEWYIYFDNTGTLIASQTFSVAVMAVNALVAIVYWDATNSVHIGLGDERHGLVMDGRTHAYLHLTRGTAVESGFGLGDISADASGGLNTSAQVSTANGIMWDEDIVFNITGNAVPANIPVLYMEGPSGTWRAATPNNYPVLPHASGRLAYNFLNGATWEQAQVGNNDFTLIHIFATNRSDSTNAYIAIQGQEAYPTKRTAREGATTEIANLITIGLPMAEFTVVGSIIFQTSDSYGNAVKARIVSTDEGDDYVNWVNIPLSPTSGPSDHGSLTGLADADHPLSALQDSGASTNDGILWSGTTWLAMPVFRIATSGIATDFVVGTPTFSHLIVIESSVGSQRHCSLALLPISTATQAALDAKEPTLAAYDTVPTNASTNIVESNGVFDALATKSDTTHTHTSTDVGAAAAVHTHSLSDIEQSSATTGQVPTWNATNTEWEAATPAAGGSGGSGDKIKMLYVETMAATDKFPICKFPVAATISKVTAQTKDGTFTYNLEERAEATPDTSGTVVFSSVKLGWTTMSSESSFANAGMAADKWLYFVAASVSTTPPTKSWITVHYSED